MDKKQFGYIFTAGMCMLPTIILIVVWFATGGKVVEANMFEEVAKWIVGGAFVVGILEVFTYVLGQFAYDFWYRKKHDVPYDGEA